MNKQHDESIKTGDISGIGIAVGHGAQASVTIKEENLNEISSLLEQLRAEIEKAVIPDGAKKVLLEKAIPEMERALQSNNPKSGLERGLERINGQLEGIGVVATNVSGIIETVAKIAEFAGIALAGIAPFLSMLLSKTP